MTNKLIIFSAPSGAGKTTIVHKVLQNIDNLEFSISACSRTKRVGETNGKDYYFLTPQIFKLKIQNNEFLEWEEVYMNKFYGTLYSEIDRIAKNGNHAIFDVDVIGGLNIKEKFNERALAIFVKPPSIEELRQRLIKRGTDSMESISQRIEKAETELKQAYKFDRIILNDELQKAVDEAIKMVADFINS